jgi:DNA-binding SARP family transcriptional activator
MGLDVGREAPVADRQHLQNLHPPSSFRLCLLGGFQLFVDHGVVDVPTSVQRVVSFLALHDRPLQRTFVAGTCWSAASEKRALASLRSVLWRLHRLGLTLVNASTDHVWLDLQVEVDYREATAVARVILESSGDLDPEELTLLQLGETLLPDRFEDWAVMERERLMQLRLHALERLSERLVAAGMYAEAVEAALAAVAAEPLRESAHRALIGVYLAEGNTISAHRQYEVCRRLLADELQVAPSRLMQELMSG